MRQRLQERSRQRSSNRSSTWRARRSALRRFLRKPDERLRRKPVDTIREVDRVTARNRAARELVPTAERGHEFLPKRGSFMEPCQEGGAPAGIAPERLEQELGQRFGLGPRRAAREGPHIASSGCSTED